MSIIFTPQVLIVTRNAEEAEGFEEFLNSQGCEVYIAKSGREASEFLAQDEFDLIVSEVLAGDINAMDLLKSLKRRKVTPPTFLIGKPSSNELIEAVHLGVIDFIDRPALLEEMVGAFERLINRLPQDWINAGRENPIRIRNKYVSQARIEEEDAEDAINASMKFKGTKPKRLDSSGRKDTSYSVGGDYADGDGSDNQYVIANRAGRGNSDGPKTTVEDLGDTTFKDLIVDVVQKIRNGELHLPRLHPVQVEVNQLLESSTPNLDRMRIVMSKDQTLNKLMMRISNSPVYARGTKTFNLSNAIGQMGVKNTGIVTNCYYYRNLYKTERAEFNPIMNRLWLHSLATGRIAQNIASESGVSKDEEYFNLGFIHDIGKVFLLSIFDKMEESEKSNQLLTQHGIIENLNSYHTDFGEVLLRAWGEGQLPLCIVREHHHVRENRDSKTMRPLNIVDMANRCTRTIGLSVHEAPDRDPWSRVPPGIQCTAKKIEEITEEASTWVGHIRGYF